MNVFCIWEDINLGGPGAQCYWQNIYVPHKIYMLKPNPHCSGICRWSLWEASWVGLMPLSFIKPLQKRPLPLFYHVRSHTAKRWSFMNQEESSHQTPNPQCLDLGLQSPEPWEISFCCLSATQSITFCYTSLNGKRQMVTERGKPRIILKFPAGTTGRHFLREETQKK